MHGLADGLSAGQLNFRPGAGRWSIGQCLDHLRVSMVVYLDPMEHVIDRAKDAGRTGEEPYSRGTWLGRRLVGALRKPGAHYPAPPSFRPRRGELDPTEACEALDAEIGRLQRAAERCDGLALGRVTMPWPVFGLVRISLAQAFELQALHVERHLDQAERVARDASFPSDG
jgi:hypothetical protein